MWNPGQYLKFSGERTRAAADLLARVPLDSPRRVVDLGCGTGTSTALLAARWPRARVAGVDSSAAMLQSARSEFPTIEWVEADLRDWRPAEPCDLLFSNAALHWAPDHARLFPALLGGVAPGGVFAAQMPRQYEAPSHVLMRQVAAASPWVAKLEGASGLVFTHPPEFYYRLLRPLVDALDLWETEYLHVVDGPAAVLEWVRSTSLRPFLERLDESERADFEGRYLQEIETAYPRQPDGRVLLPYRRLFLVAVAKYSSSEVR